MFKTSCRLTICLDKCLTGLTQVPLRNTMPRRFGVGAVIDVVHVDGHRRRVIEGTQHATDILVRTVLAPAFAQRPRRFAFEVDQVGIALDHQHLAQMQIAVDANLQTADGFFRQILHVAENGFFSSSSVFTSVWSAALSSP